MAEQNTPTDHRIKGTVYIVDAGTYLRAYAIPRVMQEHEPTEDSPDDAGSFDHPEDIPVEDRKDWQLVALLNRDSSIALLDSRFRHEREFFEMGCAGAYFDAEWSKDSSPNSERLKPPSPSGVQRMMEPLKSLFGRDKNKKGKDDVTITFLTPE